VFAAGRYGFDEVRILPVARTIGLAGKSADDGQGYNPTLSCANRAFMLFRMNRDTIRFRPRLSEEGNREGKNFFIWIRCNPLKSPDSAKGIQGNASLFPCGGPGEGVDRPTATLWRNCDRRGCVLRKAGDADIGKCTYGLLDITLTNITISHVQYRLDWTRESVEEEDGKRKVSCTEGRGGRREP
jgi:hypothetical protein